MAQASRAGRAHSQQISPAPNSKRKDSDGGTKGRYRPMEAELQAYISLQTFATLGENGMVSTLMDELRTQVDPLTMAHVASDQNIDRLGESISTIGERVRASEAKAQAGDAHTAEQFEMLRASMERLKVDSQSAVQRQQAAPHISRIWGRARGGSAHNSAPVLRSPAAG